MQIAGEGPFALGIAAEKDALDGLDHNLDILFADEHVVDPNLFDAAIEIDNHVLPTAFETLHLLVAHISYQP